MILSHRRDTITSVWYYVSRLRDTSFETSFRHRKKISGPNWPKIGTQLKLRRDQKTVWIVENLDYLDNYRTLYKTTFDTTLYYHTQLSFGKMLPEQILPGQMIDFSWNYFNFMKNKIKDIFFFWAENGSQCVKFDIWSLQGYWFTDVMLKQKATFSATIYSNCYILKHDLKSGTDFYIWHRAWRPGQLESIIWQPSASSWRVSFFVHESLFLFFLPIVF